MLQAYCLKFHRWLTLLFTLPLFAVIATGLILSFEPLLQQTELDVPLTKADVLGYLAKHDPAGNASALTLRSYEESLTISGVGADGEIEIDLGTRDIASAEAGVSLSDVFRFARQVHQRLFGELEWLVIASTFAMCALIMLGLLMGWPRLRNTVGGWHQLAAWGTLPMLILSPLTGLAIAYGVTFTSSSTDKALPRMSIRESVEILAAKHDLSSMTSLRQRGGRMVARVFVNGALTNFTVTPSGLVEPTRNWPRAIHEGNWTGWLAPALNIIVSGVFLGLLGTGIFIWLRRKIRLVRLKEKKALSMGPAE